jgi:2,4-diketo-3-deoxy-L-fuconate hydrolase
MIKHYHVTSIYSSNKLLSRTIPHPKDNYVQRLQPLTKFIVLIILMYFVTSCTFKETVLYPESEKISPSELNNIEIATLNDAITFARYEANGLKHMLAVKSYMDGKVTGVDLSETLAGTPNDPIELFNGMGYDSIVKIVEAETKTVTIPVTDLIIPADFMGHHIAAGANFPEHANEIGVNEGPFLFPKITAPTSAFSAVSTRKGLLDYEVEVAWVVLESLNEGEIPQNMGLILCNDYTDRETLLKNLDSKNIESGEGFTTGKSFPGYLPVGNLFVIPKDYHAFTNELALNLYVNYSLRQSSLVNRTVWDIDEIFEQIWSRKDVTWDDRGKQVSLFSESDNSSIKKGVLIMSGTPPGTIFNDLNIEEKVTGAVKWLLFGFNESIPQQAINDYISDAKGAGVYLFPDDKVDIHVNKLGVIRNMIVE